ncbi:NUDIX hydrolase [Falsiroseomonas sp. CW058]|uniref:NUDIX hydrolase n=1 Tax=Falsiroseomonas sp. CW058 TaxID=3388664 RepID=UPI003D3132CD
MTDAPPWTVLDSRKLVEDRWISLRAERLRTAEGVEIAPWYVLDYPDWVAAVVLTADDRLVLVRQWRHGAQAWSLELPGGVIDREDADPVAAAIRETREETGYAATGWRYLQAGYANPAIQTNRIHAVLGTGAHPAGDAAPEPGEAIRVELVPVADVLAGIGAGMIGQSMHVGAILVGLAAAGRIRL